MIPSGRDSRDEGTMVRRAPSVKRYVVRLSSEERDSSPHSKRERPGGPVAESEDLAQGRCSCCRLWWVPTQCGRAWSRWVGAVEMQTEPPQPS
jgi:hypothetical protein